MTPLPWTMAVLAVLFALTPKWTRPDLYFGVTVQPDFVATPQARSILHRFWWAVALNTLAGLGIAFASGPLGLAWQIGGLTWAVARAHRATTSYASPPNPVREASLTPRAGSLPGSWPLAFGPFLILIAAAVYAAYNWEQLPQRLPIHWGVRGADRWIDKTPGNLTLLLLLLASVAGSLLLPAYGILRWSRRISVTGPRARGEAMFQNAVVSLMIVLQYLIVIPAVVLMLWPDTPAAWVWPVLFVTTAAAAIILLIRLGQGGSRAAQGSSANEPPMGDRTPDTAWKWGQIYYNPSDPALIVEKRFGLGYTLNFGNRWSWVLVAALLAPALLSIALR